MSRTISSSTPSTTCRCWNGRPDALDQAAPLAGWKLPEEYATLCQQLEARMGQTWQAAIRTGAPTHGGFLSPGGPPRRAGRPAPGRNIGFDAVKHLLLCRIEGRPNGIDLDFYPHLAQISVKTTRARDYLTLLSGSAA